MLLPCLVLRWTHSAQSLFVAQHIAKALSVACSPTHMHIQIRSLQWPDPDSPAAYVLAYCTCSVRCIHLQRQECLELYDCSGSSVLQSWYVSEVCMLVHVKMQMMNTIVVQLSHMCHGCRGAALVIAMPRTGRTHQVCLFTLTRRLNNRHA